MSAFLLVPIAAITVAYAFVWFLYLSSPLRRSIRSVAFLIGTTGVLVVAVSIGWEAGTVASLGVAALWVAGLWDLNEILAPMPSKEASFDRQLWRIKSDVWSHRRALKLRDWEAGRTSHVAVLTEALRRTNDLSPPSADWNQLHDAVLNAVEFDLSVFIAERSMNSSTASASLARWEGIERQWKEVRRRRARFWKLLR